MAEARWLARAEEHTGIAAMDISTAVHFGVGTVAGLAGIDPKVALLVALITEGSWEMIKARDPEAIFHRGVGQSRMNEIVDLLSIMAGAYVGAGIRSAIRHETAPEAAPLPAVATAPVLPEATAPAGLGACCRW
jgi:hypothetical protein